MMSKKSFKAWERLEKRMQQDAKKASVESERFAALTNQAEISKAARKGRYWSSRLVAIEKLTDQKELAYVAKNDRSWRVRIAVAEKLDDQALAMEVYEDLVKKCTDVTGREAACIKAYGEHDLIKCTCSRCHAICHSYVGCVCSCGETDHIWEEGETIAVDYGSCSDPAPSWTQTIEYVCARCAQVTSRTYSG